LYEEYLLTPQPDSKKLWSLIESQINKEKQTQKPKLYKINGRINLFISAAAVLFVCVFGVLWLVYTTADPTTVISDPSVPGIAPASLNVQEKTVRFVTNQEVTPEAIAEKAKAKLVDNCIENGCKIGCNGLDSVTQGIAGRYTVDLYAIHEDGTETDRQEIIIVIENP